MQINIFNLSAFLTFFILLFPFELSHGLYLSHIWIFIFFIIIFFNCVKNNSLHKTSFLFLFLFLFFIFIDSINYLRFQAIPNNFASESTKYGLFLLGIYSFIYLFSSKKLNSDDWLVFLAVSILFYSLYAVLTVDDAYTYGGRLQVENLGSSNTLSVITSLCALIFLNGFIRTKSYYKVVFITLLVLSLIVIILTESRGGLFSFVGGSFYLLTRNFSIRKIFFLIVIVCSLLYVLLLLDFFDRFFSSRESYTSGRFEIWMLLIPNLFQSISSVLFGFGSGSVDFVLFGKEYNSAHSGPLTLAYYYGFIYLIIFSLIIFHISKNLYYSTSSNKNIKIAILIAFFISFFTDNLFLASQSTLPFSIFLGFSFSNWNKNYG